MEEHNGVKLYCREVLRRAHVDVYGKMGYVKMLEYFWGDEEFAKKCNYRKHIKFKPIDLKDFLRYYINKPLDEEYYLFERKLEIIE